MHRCFLPGKAFSQGLDNDISKNNLLQLPAAKQIDIANELDRKPGEVLKKLEDIRNKIL